MADSFDPYHRWLAIPPAEQPAHDYRLLGLALFEEDPAVIESAADQRMAHLRTFQAGKHSAECQKLLNEVSAARIRLLHPEKKAAYDADLRRRLKEEGQMARAIDEREPGPAPLGPIGPVVDTHVPRRPKRKEPNVASMVGAGAAVVGAVVLLGLLISWMTGGPGPEEPIARVDNPPAPVVSPPVPPPPVMPPPSQPRESIPAPGPPDSVGASGGEPSQGPPAGSADAGLHLPEDLPAAASPGAAPPPPAVAPFGEERARELQARWSGHLQMPVTVTNSIGMKLVLIPPGEFDMGSTEEEIAAELRAARERNEPKWYFDMTSSEGPRHHVRVTKAFHLGMYEVTQQEYEQVMGVNPSIFSAQGTAAASVTGLDTSRHPVETVSWQDARAFCERLSDMPAEKAAGRVYRLPTEAEWEYACRAGTTTRWVCGDDLAALEDYAWYGESARNRTQPVGEKLANPFGLFDMHGNVFEWCQDWLAKDYYVNSPVDDPPGPPSGTERAGRGGWWEYPWYCRSAARGGGEPGRRDRYIGFRVAAVGVETPGEDKSGKVWDVSTGRLLASMPEGNVVDAVDFHPSGSVLATGGLYDRLTLWDLDVQ